MTGPLSRNYDFIEGLGNMDLWLYQLNFPGNEIYVVHAATPFTYLALTSNNTWTIPQNLLQFVNIPNKVLR